MDKINKKAVELLMKVLLESIDREETEEERKVLEKIDHEDHIYVEDNGVSIRIPLSQYDSWIERKEKEKKYNNDKN